MENLDIYEDCIMCGKKTETLKTTHIDFRYGYVEGAGQLCRSCYLGVPLLTLAACLLYPWCAICYSLRYTYAF